MPVRPFHRGQSWLVPPSWDELVDDRHPVRFVATFVESLGADFWQELGIKPGGELEGAPGYDPELLLSVWLFGFMSGVRSSRRLEAACREQLPLRWLTGNQQPDHNTLWRFYEGHRWDMRKLLRLSLRTAVVMGLVDLAVQAVDGTKVKGNASPDRNYTRQTLEKLSERAEAAINDLEAQNQTGGDKPNEQLPAELSQARALRSKVQEALKLLGVEESGERVNLTDADASVMRSRSGFLTGYNAQAVAAPLKQAKGQIITAAAVVTEKNDVEQLLPMIEAAGQNTGQPAGSTLADAGYHSGANLSACEAGSYTVVMPSTQDKALANPYHKDRFLYDPHSDSYTCPEGKRLRYAGEKAQAGRRLLRRYKAVSPAACRACPAFGACTTDKRQGRSLHIGVDDEVLKRHRLWMASPEAKDRYRLRKQLIEPVFGIIKEQLDGRRFLLRGLSNVASEWSLLATAFNLRVLARF